jgi:polo-like kinase 1
MTDSAIDKNKMDDVVIVEEKLVNIMGDPLIKKYTKGKFLGKGGFAKVYEFTSMENNKVMAAKIIPKATLKKSRHRQKLLSEIKIHRGLVHSTIVKFEHVFEDNENVYILLEMCTNQTLNDLCKRRKRLTEFEAQYYIYQIVNALKYLQKNRVIHRDLKLGNLFLNDKLEIKLGDFGLAAKLDFDNEKRHTICGTPNYLAPEVLSSKSGHGYEVDVWSLGVVLYALVVGKPPFETPEVKMTYEKIKKVIYSFPEQIPLSENVKNLITKIFVADPSKRPTLDQILEHPFLNNGVGVPKTMHISTLAMAPNKKTIDDMLAKETAVPAKNNPLSASNINSQFELGKSGPSNVKSKVPTGSILGTTGGDDGQGNEIYVKKWVDYSSKYGLGYLLSNGNIGVFFNDCTKVIYDSKRDVFEYLERRNNDRQDILTSWTLKIYPKELHKKVTLLLHFRSYLEGIKAINTAPSDNAEEVPVSQRQAPMVYLKKWMKTKHASLLRLSNKIVQVAFLDNTEIILSSESKLVTFVNKKGERIKCPIVNALDSENTDLTKRLKYTKEILTLMLNNNRNGSANNNMGPNLNL